MITTSEKRKLFSELRDRVGAGQRCPSLAWIVKFLRLKDEAQAETALRELERDGVIDVLRAGPYPWVSVLRNTYMGVKVAGMTLDPERFDKFTDGTDVLKIAVEPDVVMARPVRMIDDEIDEPDTQEARVPARKAHIAEESTSASRDEVSASSPEREVQVAPPVPTEISERPEVETVQAEQEFPDAGNPSPAELDQGPTAAPPPAQVAEVERAPDLAPSQSVEARQPHPWALIELSEIESFLTQHDMKPTTFGKLAGVGTSYVANARAGLQSGEKVSRRLRTFMAEYVPDAVVSQLSRKGHAAHRPAITLPPKAKLVAPTADLGRQLSIKVPVDVHAQFAREAAQRELPLGTVARERILEALADRGKPAPEPVGKPHIRAAVVRAWGNDGRPFGDFITALIDMGLETYLEFREAAE